MARSNRTRNRSSRRRPSRRNRTRRNRNQSTRNTTTTTIITTRRFNSSPISENVTRGAIYRYIPLSFIHDKPDNIPSGVGVAFYLGAGELLSFSPLAIGDTSIHHLSFTRAKVNWITMKVIPSAKLSERGGELACALVPVPFDTLEHSTTADYDYNLSLYSYAVNDIALMRGGKIGSAVKTLQTTWRSRSVDGSQIYRRLGLQTPDNKINANPVVVGIVGYSNLAFNSVGDVAALYAASECTFDIEIKASVSVCDPVRNPVTITSQVSYTTPVLRDAVEVGQEAFTMVG